jgi:hypothetical protein
MEGKLNMLISSNYQNINNRQINSNHNPSFKAVIIPGTLKNMDTDSLQKIKAAIPKLKEMTENVNLEIYNSAENKILLWVTPLKKNLKYDPDLLVKSDNSLWITNAISKIFHKKPVEQISKTEIPIVSSDELSLKTGSAEDIVELAKTTIKNFYDHPLNLYNDIKKLTE